MKIYIICPAYVVTGGIELIHQLSYKLNLLGFESFIYYYGVKEGKNPINDVYKKYNVRWAENIENISENIIIFPEVYFFLASDSGFLTKKIIWWMSVDNAKGTDEEFRRTWADKDIIHLSQSQYASNFLRDNGVPENSIFWLSDYINSDYLHLKEVPDEEKDVNILFNPKKGFIKTASIIGKSTGHVKWISLSNLYPQAMRDIMQHSRVYIDFGNHPGRDRIPREAVMCGCLVVSNRRGAAANDVDVLIDSRYKFDDETEPDKIYDVIYKLVTNYSEEKKNFERYRQRTANEFKCFEVDALKAFSKICGKEINSSSADVLKEKMLEYIYLEKYDKAFQTLVQYRYNGYNIDAELIIIEATIRIELGELYEAEYELNDGVKMYTDNYEMILLLARLHSLMDGKEELIQAVKECQKAIDMSLGTEDERAVTEQAKMYMAYIRNKIS